MMPDEGSWLPNTRSRDHAAEYDRFVGDDEYHECGAGCGAVGRAERAIEEGRACACGEPICRACWAKGAAVCVACARREEDRAAAEFEALAKREGGVV